MWWSILIAVGVAVAQFINIYLGWRVTVHPPSADNRRLRRLYEAGFVLAGLFTIALVGIATYRQAKSQQDSTDAFMQGQRELKAQQQASDRKIDAVWALLTVNPMNTEPATPEGKSAPKKPTSPTPPPSADKEAPSTPPSTKPPITLPPSPGILTISQAPKISTRADAPYETEVIVQTTKEFPSLKLAIQCNKDLVYGVVVFGGIRMMTRWGVLKDNPNIFFFSYESAVPQFGPAHPIVVDLWSREPIVCNQVATF